MSSGSPPPVRRFELDWIVVPVSGIRRWGVLLTLLVVVGAALGVVLYLTHEPVERRASRLLRQATSTQEELRKNGVSDGLSGEFDEASRLLDEAHHDWDRKDYPACEARATDSLRRFELLGGLASRDFVGSGQVIALQGKVEVQRANQTRWDRAREKMPLYNGDFVKTGSDASSEILFSDNTVYRIGPDSLLEVHREARGGREPSGGEVKVKVGQVNVFTASNPSMVVTDAARAEVERESRVGVEVAENSATTFAAYAGKASVTGSTGESVELGSRQAVSAAAGGTLGQRRPVPAAPLLERPALNTVINLDSSGRVELAWRPVPGSETYHLQVSRSRIFSPANLEVDADGRPGNIAALKVRRAGTYYWRVASVGQDRLRSEWSTPRSFRAFMGARVEELTDTAPPKLQVEKPTQMGNLIIVQGTTEPGATVTVNGEVVEVAGDGSFKKALALNREGWNTIVIRATDPSGNVAEEKKSVFVEVE